MIKKVEKSVKIDGQDETVDIYVVKPSNEVLKQGDRHKAKTWNICLQDNILIKKELDVIMEKRGIWDKSKSKKEQEITNEIIDCEKKLYKGDGKRRPKVSEGQKIAIRMRRLRLELRDLIAEKMSMEENTAESLAENARFDYFVSQCSFYKDNDKKIYNDLDDYNKRSSDEIAFAAATALGEIMYNLDSSFEANLPENKWLSRFGLIDEDLSLVNTEGTLVDTDGKKISEDGFYLDENGNRTDREGTPLDDDGNYIMVEYENDLAPKTPRKKKTTRKTAQTKTSKVTQVTES